MHSVDIYSEKYKIAVEIEKSEIKRIPHDVIKLINAAKINKIKYGVIIYPKIYHTETSKSSRYFEKILNKDIRFYMGDIIKSSSLNEILFISYEYNVV